MFTFVVPTCKVYSKPPLYIVSYSILPKIYFEIESVDYSGDVSFLIESLLSWLILNLVIRQHIFVYPKNGPNHDISISVVMSTCESILKWFDIYNPASTYEFAYNKKLYGFQLFDIKWGEIVILTFKLLYNLCKLITWWKWLYLYIRSLKELDEETKFWALNVYTRIVPSRLTLQLTLIKIFTYIMYLYIFITIKTAPQLNRLSHTV